MIPIRRAILTCSLRRQFPQIPRQPVFQILRFYSASLQPTEYHRLADETMDKLTAELETLLEENDVTGSDVEYSVLTPPKEPTYRGERGVDTQTGQARYICDQ